VKDTRGRQAEWLRPRPYINLPPKRCGARNGYGSRRMGVGGGLGAQMRKDGKSDFPLPPLIAGWPSFHDQFTKASAGLREVKTYIHAHTWTCISYNAYIYIHASGFRPVVGLIYSDIVSANGNLSPENPPYTVLYIISVLQQSFVRHNYIII